MLNYSWANPDGRFTDKAQKALSEEFPEAKVWVHGRDAIITGPPDGVDVDAADELVRNLGGVRNVKEDTAAADAAVAPDLADSIARELGSTPAPTTALPVGRHGGREWCHRGRCCFGACLDRCCRHAAAVDAHNGYPDDMGCRSHAGLVDDIAAPTTVAPTTSVAPATLVSPVTSPTT